VNRPLDATTDGHTLATAGRDDTVLLWDLTDPARTLSQHSMPRSAAAKG
jgi:WD40 repeat protein